MSRPRTGVEAVDAWHAASTELTIYEWLGMDEETYRSFVEQGEAGLPRRPCTATTRGESGFRVMMAPVRGRGRSKWRNFILAATVGVFACGGSEHPTGTASGPPCNEVAQHLVSLAAADNAAEPDPQLATGMQSEFERQCRENPWSPQRRSCLAASRTQDATLRCPAE